MKPKRCLECNKIFIPTCGTQKYCPGPHVATCIICGAEFSYTCRPTERSHTCSDKCKELMKEQTVQRKHNVRNVSQLQWVRDKIREANTPEVKAKRAATSLKNTGYDNPAKSPEVRAKMSEIMKSEKYLSGRRSTCVVKYGCESPMQNQAVKDKQRATNQARYHMDGHPHTKDDYMKMMVNPTKVDAYLSFKDNPADFIATHYDQPPVISQLEQDLGVTNTPIYNILIQNSCRDLLATTYSTMEDDVVSYIRSLVPNAEIVQNDRTIIKPYELDIYLPEFNLAFECNPVATHNSSFVDPWGSDPKPYTYHQTKSKLANEADVFLFHIFGYEWNNKQTIIKSMIANLLHVNTTSIGARHTHVVDVDYETCKKFLSVNHRQGNTNSSIRLGLVDNATNELLSVMTFNKPRSTLGKCSDECEYELARFCSKLFINVPGGANKLFQHFIKQYQPASIVSFSDVAHTKGSLYNTLGFTNVHETTPSYVWVDLYDNIYYHRVVCQKQNLQKLFYDSTIDIENQTEADIMKSHKFAQVFDSGVVKWIWRKSL